MKKNNNIFGVLLLLAFSLPLVGQDIQLNPTLNYELKPRVELIDSTSNNHYKKLLFSKFSTNKLPLFCKIEHKWSKFSGINIRMRLGSLEYVDYLENK